MGKDASLDTNLVQMLLERAKIVKAESAKILGSAVHGDLWIGTVQRLCHKHRTNVDGKFYKPNSSDVLYNLITYAHVQMQRLSYGRPYITEWKDPIHVAFNTKTKYLVMLSAGFITWGTYDNLTKMMSLRLGDCEVQVPAERLLAVNTAIDDGEDFLRGVPLLNYDGLSHIKCETVPLEIRIPKKPTNRKRKPKRR